MVSAERKAGRPGRPKGIARTIAEETGLSVRTVHRALAGQRGLKDETADAIALRQFLETFRNFASFCRENDAEKVSQWRVTNDQADKLREYNEIVGPWLQRLNQSDE